MNPLRTALVVLTVLSNYGTGLSSSALTANLPIYHQNQEDTLATNQKTNSTGSIYSAVRTSSSNAEHPIPFVATFLLLLLNRLSISSQKVQATFQKLQSNKTLTPPPPATCHQATIAEAEPGGNI